MKKACIIAAVFVLVIAVLSLLLTLVGRTPSVLKGKVALVKIEGVIGMNLDALKVIDEIKQYRKDHSVKALIVRVNSPGGVVAPSQEIYEELKKVRDVKPVVVSMGSLAASGGYYIAVAAEKIVAMPGTMTGSIGVIMELPNVQGLMDKVGIKTEVIKSGKHKDIGSIYRSMTKDERLILGKLLDDVHDQFIEAVAEGRDMAVEDVRPFADGRVFTGRQALKLGFVDEMGTLEDAIALAGQMGGIEGEPEVVSRKPTFSFRDFIRGDMEEMFRGMLGAGNSRQGISLKYLMVP